MKPTGESLTSETARKRHWRVIFILSLCIFTALLFFRLTEFPSYFFCDEAIQGVEAESLINTGMDTYGAPWPLLFKAYGSYHLSLSVYAHIPLQLLMGKSVFSVRSAGVLAGVLMVVALTLLLRRLQFGRELTCLTPLLLVVSPFYFLHLRTGFEMVFSLAAWAWFVYLFDRIFAGNVRTNFLSPLLLAFVAAVAFYTYTPARGWVALTLPVMMLANLRQMLSRWVSFLNFVLCLCLFLSPYLDAVNNNPEMAFGRLKALGVTLKADSPLQEIQRALPPFAEIIDPRYWLIDIGPTSFESWPRHTIPGRSLLPSWFVIFLPLGLCALIYAARRRALARALLLLLPIGAFPAVFVNVNPLRCAPIGTLYFLISLHGMFLAIETVTDYLNYRKLCHTPLAIALAVNAIFFVRTVLDYDRFKYTMYSFYGVQAGSPEVFDWISKHQDVEQRILLSSSSFNESEVLARFYFGENWRDFLTVGDIISPCVLASPNDGGLWILREEDFQQFLEAACPVNATVLETIKSVAQTPLFKIVRLKSSITNDEWVSREETRRRIVERELAEVGGQTITVWHPKIDYGEISNLFDGKENTIARSDRIRPFILRLDGFNGNLVRGITVVATNCEEAVMNLKVRTSLGEPVSFDQQVVGTREICRFITSFSQPLALSGFDVSIDVLNAGDDRVHLGEIEIESAAPSGK